MPSEVEASLDFSHPASNELAGGGARTHTALRPLDFESSASANSATPATRSLKLRNQKRSSSGSDAIAASLLPTAVALQNCARACYRLKFSQQFLWSPLQAVEKYLKAILLYNDRSAKGLGYTRTKLRNVTCISAPVIQRTFCILRLLLN